MIKIFKDQNGITLDRGHTLPHFHLAYQTFGEMNADKSNVVWIFHALTANCNPMEWWPELVGNGKFLDPDKYFIICVNKPGSAYGSISPISIDPETGGLYFDTFPFFSIRDIVQCYIRLRKFLKIEKIFLGIGGSTGGMQVLQWAIDEPQLFEHIVPMATAAALSPWGIAFNASQRMAIEADTSWQEKDVDAGKKGLAAARSIALLSYRHYDGYGLVQHRSRLVEAAHEQVFYAADSYQRYQGQKFVNRFNVVCYYKLTQTMDSHDVSTGYNSAEDALKKILAKVLIVAIDSDLLFPLEEQKFLQKNIAGSSLLEISSQFGHDGFLIEFDKIEKGLADFLER